jgi:hypothetical protein
MGRVLAPPLDSDFIYRNFVSFVFISLIGIIARNWHSSLFSIKEKFL